ncbi:general secretion pathway protein GspD [Lutibacter sp. HS1-25]|uniref:type II secretion system protein GspD n=1 Tax=Lutibacter sp. HS1-25 TaxID=2485000 RepID=UPI00101112C7|nr:general secretion pathway protein GspD [Lutibacter sp. HS1-25]RXP46189.1 general secretion pathway protein GspD [Lutibacter sp. HS1-25]
MNKKSFLIVIFIIINCCSLYAQNSRIDQLKLKLESITIDAPGLTEKADVNVNNVLLPDFLRSLASAHEINLNIDADLNNIIIANNFSNSTVAHVLLFVCNEYNLTIEFIGNILSIKKVEVPIVKPENREIPITYNDETQLFSIDLQKDSLYIAFKLITDKTGKNLVFEPGLENMLLSAYIQNMPFDSALDKIAFSNNITVTKTRDNYYLFEKNNLGPSIANQQLVNKHANQNQSRSNGYYKILDPVLRTLDVDFENAEIATIIRNIGLDLNVNMFTSTPLPEAGRVSVKANGISFDLLLDHMLENTAYTYKKQDDIYYFGKKESASLRNTIAIPLMHRSIEIMNNQTGNQQNSFNNSNINSYGVSQNNLTSNSQNRQSINTSNSNSFTNYASKAEALVNILPDEIKQNLEIKVDVELNSFIVSGPSQDILKFREFIKSIDKPIPVIAIEVMILAVAKSATLETGVSFGIGDEPVQTQGSIFPNADLTVSGKDVSKILGGNNILGALNLGKVVPNFYMNIKAMEANGDVDIQSTPKLSTLNGHRSSLSIGETTYYVVTNVNYFGSQIPQTSEIKNFEPIEAKLQIDLKPLVSGDGQVTMEINVEQSTFSGGRISPEAPPNMDSRKFTSIVRVKDQDLIMLGGLEEKVKNDSGTGVPFLSRIPVIKWFFSTRSREDSSKKLVILIKPTIIY